MPCEGFAAVMTGRGRRTHKGKVGELVLIVIIERRKPSGEIERIAKRKYWWMSPKRELQEMIFQERLKRARQRAKEGKND